MKNKFPVDYEASLLRATRFPPDGNGAAGSRSGLLKIIEGYVFWRERESWRESNESIAEFFRARLLGEEFREPAISSDEIRLFAQLGCSVRGVIFARNKYE